MTPGLRSFLKSNSISCDFPDAADETANSRNPKWTRLSLQDLIALYAPELILGGIIAVIAAMMYNPTMKMLLYGALPDSKRTPMWFIICFGEEFRHLLSLATIMVPVLQIHVITFDILDDTLRKIAASALNT